MSGQSAGSAGVLALVSDLMTRSQISGAAARAGMAVRFASTVDAMISAAGGAPARLVIVDVGEAGADMAKLVESLRPLVPSAKIIAFGPHVHVERLEAAAEAGCDRVMARGAFLGQLDAILGDR